MSAQRKVLSVRVRREKKLSFGRVLYPADDPSLFVRSVIIRDSFSSRSERSKFDRSSNVADEYVRVKFSFFEKENRRRFEEDFVIRSMERSRDLGYLFVVL